MAQEASPFSLESASNCSSGERVVVLGGSLTGAQAVVVNHDVCGTYLVRLLGSASGVYAKLSEELVTRHQGWD